MNVVAEENENKKTGEEREVIGNLLGESRPTVVRIVLDPTISRSKPIEIGEFIVIEYPNELIPYPVLGVVHEVVLVNTDIPDELIDSPQTYEQLERIINLKEGERLEALASIYGYYDPNRRRIILPRFPAPPGSKVYRATKDELSPIFMNGDIRVGVLRSHPEVEVRLNVNELVRRHVAILAITGGGKGNTVAVLATRMLNLNGAIVIVDPHEEYAILKEQYPGKVVVFTPRGNPDKGYYKLSFKLSKFTSDEIADIIGIPKNATNQRALLSTAINEKLKDRNDWGFDDLETALEKVGVDKNYKNSLLGVLNRLKVFLEKDIFSKTDETPLHSEAGPSIIKPGQITVLSLSGLPLQIQQSAVAQVFQRIYEAGIRWRRHLTGEALPCPVFCVIEEAHNFIPAQKGTKSSSIIKRIAAEGRKFGVGLCLVSQRPGKLDSDALSQCNTQIILRIVNPNDQNQIRSSAEAISEELLADLPSLNPGEAIIIGPSTLLPAHVKIDKFEGELGGDDIEIVSEWKKTLESSPKEELMELDAPSDIDAFYQT